LLTHGSLFTGIGMFDYAAEKAGIKNVWQCEINPYRQKILKLRFNEKIYKDIKKLKRPGRVDIVSAGFPCTDVSRANANGTDIDGENTGLYKHLVRIVQTIKPTAVIFENSPELLKKGFEKILYDFYGLGYNVWWDCFYASQFGYPQKRKRLYAVCTNSNKIGRKEVEIFSQKLKEACSNKKSERFILGVTFNGVAGSELQSPNYSDFLRMDNGDSNRVDRLEAIGDSIIWEIAYNIFKTLKIIL
jgi:DNA (cytosine-5)-methyltransferase 1